MLVPMRVTIDTPSLAASGNCDGHSKFGGGELIINANPFEGINCAMGFCCCKTLSNVEINSVVAPWACIVGHILVGWLRFFRGGYLAES